MLDFRRALPLLLTALVLACGSNSDPAPAPTPTATIEAPSATSSPNPTSTPEPAPDAWNARVTRLTIQALGIDAPVVGSQIVPDTSVAPSGCPPTPPGQDTLTVPPEGIATPEVAIDGLEEAAWIFGHSRWQGVPGLFFALQDIEVGDVLLVEATDRDTGAPLPPRRFLVEGLYLADKDAGSVLLESTVEAPAVILQTSVRETGANRPWILDRGPLLARATNIVEGDLDDPCKYLLLFVVARAA
ncbi:MAG: hypothetical protein R3C39_11325 [Dehalococcoidia bacterium]